MRAERRGFGAFALVLTTVFLVFPGSISCQIMHPHGDVGGSMTFALAGDAIITRKLSVFDEPEFLALRELVQSADAGFVNLEILFHNWEPDVIPAASSCAFIARTSCFVGSSTASRRRITVIGRITSRYFPRTYTSRSTS